MTQSQYLQWMVNVCGDKIPASASGQDLINWARGKGMNPAGGWQLNAKLSREVVAQTLVQLLNLAPRKSTFDANRILEREGIILTSTDGYVTVKNLVKLIDDGFSRKVNPGRGHGHHGDDDDDDDRPTSTKPGNGNGGSGPPGHTGIFPGKGNQKNGPHGGH